MSTVAAAFRIHLAGLFPADQTVQKCGKSLSMGGLKEFLAIFADIPHNRLFLVVFTPGWEILKKFFFQSA